MRRRLLASLFPLVSGVVIACGGEDDLPRSSASGGAPGSGGISSIGGAGGLASPTAGGTEGSGGASETGGVAGRSGGQGGSPPGGTGPGGSAGAGGGGTGGESAGGASGAAIGGASATGGASGAAAAGTGGAAAGGLVTGGGSGAESAGSGGELLGVPVAFTQEPTFTGNDNPAAPQAGVLRLATDVVAAVRVTVTGSDEEWTLDLPPATVFEKPILGLKPDTTYAVSLTATAGDNTLTAGPLEWTTPPLPEDFIPLAVAVSEPDRMEPGMTLFAVREGWQMTTAPILIVDHAGVVRWYFSDPENRAQEDLIQLADGHLLFGRDFCNLREIDLLGNVVAAWHATEWPRTCDTIEGSVPVPVVDFHHESSLLASGNLLTLSTETRTVEGMPTDEDDPDADTQTALVMGSAIVEFSPQGEIIKRISLLDLLDPTRIGRDALDTSWTSQHVAGGQRPLDWDHANAVIYDAASDSYYVSLRHQDAVVKVNRTAETLTWILGNPANWVEPWSDKLLTPAGDLLWPFHQHAVELNALGVGLYDNGNYRAAAFEAFDPEVPQFSRAVAYAVDEASMTVSEVWSYGPPSGEDSFFSPGMGDADWQPVTGNVLITSSELVIEADTPMGADTTYTQILEVTPDGTRVFELSTQGEAGSAYPAYRAERIPDIRR